MFFLLKETFMVGCGLMNFCISLPFQRYRYAEAYQVNVKLKSVEQDFLSRNPDGEEILSRMQSQSHWRAKLVVSVLNVYS